MSIPNAKSTRLGLLLAAMVILMWGLLPVRADATAATFTAVVQGTGSAVSGVRSACPARSCPPPVDVNPANFGKLQRLVTVNGPFWNGGFGFPVCAGTGINVGKAGTTPVTGPSCSFSITYGAVGYCELFSGTGTALLTSTDLLVGYSSWSGPVTLVGSFGTDFAGGMVEPVEPYGTVLIRGNLTKQLPSPPQTADLTAQLTIARDPTVFSNHCADGTAQRFVTTGGLTLTAPKVLP